MPGTRANSGMLAPIERLVLVDEMERIQTGPFESQSLPGHLLHLVTAGSVSQWAEGRAEQFGPGDVVWYYDTEFVRGRILRAPWRFITINFQAPAIPPPDDACRVSRVSSRASRLGRELLQSWRDPGMSALERQFCCHRLLIELVQEILRSTGQQSSPSSGARMWWRIEKGLRGRLEEPVDLAALHASSGLSIRTIIRACKAATGLPPMKRLREIRLGCARGMVQHSDLPMTEIAYRVGYARPQEFSRDYHRRFKVTPREDRRRSPSYLQFERPAR